ncbi:MAG: MFS transporter [Ferruginibacter sp.]
MRSITGNKWILAIIVIAQFFCTSLWFAGNAILPDLIKNLQLAPGVLANLTSAVQFGFITGTLIFAVLTISDRFSPSRVFFVSAMVAALFNLAIAIPSIPFGGLLLFRFFTGFFLAGIYPIGMKIASDHYQQGLGKSLGFLVGALVLGTAFPHLLKSLSAGLPWRYVIYAVSLLSVLGGVAMVLLVPDGRYRKPGMQLTSTAFLAGFRNAKFRAAAFGYFGHMWELYAFWAFVPVMLAAYKNYYPQAKLDVSFLSFLIIGCGALACVFSGLLSQKYGAKKIAGIALSFSGLCCIVSPFFLLNPSPVVLLAFLFFWGLVVIADSPLFSTLVAQAAPEQSRGTSLTIVNCIGFSITILSIQLVNVLAAHVPSRYVYLVLAAGPLLGLMALLGKEKGMAGKIKNKN